MKKKMLLIIISSLYLIFAYSQNWEVQNIQTNSDLYNIYFINEDIGWIIGSEGKVFKTINKGVNWSLQYSGNTNEWYKYIHFTDTLNGWIIGKRGIGSPHPPTIVDIKLQSNDGGKTWIDRLVDTAFTTFHFINSQIGWASYSDSTSKGKIIKTYDGGNTWQEQYTDSVTYIKDIYFIDNLHGWAACSDELLTGKILRTINGGDEWVTINVSSGGWGSYLFNNVFFFDTDTGWFTGEIIELGHEHYPVILGTNSSGVNFTQQLLVNTNPYFNDIFFPNSLNGWVIGYYGYLYYTINGGRDWIKNDQLTDQHLNRIYFLDQEKGWIIGNRGTLLIYNETTMNRDILNDSYNYYKIFPNPFNEKIEIQCLKNTNRPEIIEIININGVILKSENNYQNQKKNLY